MARNSSYKPTIPHQNAPAADAKIAFGEKVRSLMNNLSYNQSDLARSAGLRRDAISTYVRGLAWPDPKNLRKLSNALGVTPNDLIPGMSEIDEVSEARRQIHPGTLDKPTVQMDQIESGRFRLRLDQVVSLEVATKVLGLIESKK